MSIQAQLIQLTGRGHAFGARSGSAAIVAALHAFELPDNAQVVMPAVCCPAVMSAIQLAGFSVVFADVNISTLCSGSAEFEAAFTSDTAALIPVHSYGYPCPLKDIAQLAAARGLKVIEDACLGLGGSMDGRAYGSFGDASVVSFGYDKIVDAGGGGAVLCDDGALAQRIEQFLSANPYLAQHPASAIAAGLGDLQDNVANRLNNARRYHAELSADVVSKPHIGNVVWRYSALYKGDRAALLAEAARRGLIITTHYPSLDQFKTGPGLPNATAVSQQVINLFVRSGTSKDYVDGVIALINGR